MISYIHYSKDKKSRNNNIIISIALYEFESRSSSRILVFKENMSKTQTVNKKIHTFSDSCFI
ncbi:hypothetical protein Xenpb_00203 [Xenorhabdus sp. PB62.4]|nr:hypothetical protein [Xenorhabdus sp. PB62.4]